MCLKTSNCIFLLQNVAHLQKPSMESVHLDPPTVLYRISTLRLRVCVCGGVRGAPSACSHSTQPHLFHTCVCVSVLPSSHGSSWVSIVKLHRSGELSFYCLWTTGHNTGVTGFGTLINDQINSLQAELVKVGSKSCSQSRGKYGDRIIIENVELQKPATEDAQTARKDRGQTRQTATTDTALPRLRKAGSQEINGSREERESRSLR